VSHYIPPGAAVATVKAFLIDAGQFSQTHIFGRRGVTCLALLPAGITPQPKNPLACPLKRDFKENKKGYSMAMAIVWFIVVICFVFGFCCWCACWGFYFFALHNLKPGVAFWKGSLLWYDPTCLTEAGLCARRWACKSLAGGMISFFIAFALSVIFDLHFTL